MSRAGQRPWWTAATAAALLALPACGDEARPAASPSAPSTRAAEAPTARGERVEVPPDEEEETRRNVLEARDAPLAVGVVAPRFSGLPEKTVAVIVFFRGEW
jgi:hypothetical protein